MNRKELDNRCRYIRDITGINNKVSDEDQKWLIENVFKFHHNWYIKFFFPVPKLCHSFNEQ